MIEPRSSSLSLRFDVPPPFLFHITLSSSHLFFLSLFIHRRRLGRLVTQPYFLWENTCAPLQKSDSPGVVLLESGPGGDVQEQRSTGCWEMESDLFQRLRGRRWSSSCQFEPRDDFGKSLWVTVLSLLVVSPLNCSTSSFKTLPPWSFSGTGCCGNCDFWGAGDAFGQ